MKRQPRNKWGIIFAYSSDHAGIARELQRLEDENYRAASRMTDPREVRAYLQVLRDASRDWLVINSGAAACR